MKNFFKYGISILLIIVIIIVLIMTIFKNKDTNNTLAEKAREELNYLDLEIIGLLNSLNNITIENYKISTKEVNLGGSESNPSIDSSSSNEQESSNKSENGGEGGGKGNSSGSSSSDDGNTSATTNKSAEKIKVTELLSKNIIGNSSKINWEVITSRVENLYSIWSTIAIDLEELNVEGNKINEFGVALNELTLKIKENNKEKSIHDLVNMYEKVLTFYNSFDNNLTANERRLKEIKYNIAIAYDNVETGKWEIAKTYVKEALNKNKEILNNLDQTNEFNIRKIDIILNQIQSSLNTEDKDIFYINYRNLIEEVNLM